MSRHTRATDPETSHEAEASAVPLSRLKHLILGSLLFGPLDDEQLVNQINWLKHQVTPQRVRTARSELVHEGLVEWSGDYGTSSTGRRARVWRAVR